MFPLSPPLSGIKGPVPKTGLNWTLVQFSPLLKYWGLFYCSHFEKSLAIYRDLALSDVVIRW
jgi:hypothetical protein